MPNPMTPRLFGNTRLTALYTESDNFDWIITTVLMRFVAVFNQYQVPHTRSFATAAEAFDFLFWGYEDQHLLPYGIYDQLTDQATPYTHAGQRIHTIPQETICTMVKRHIAMTQLPVLKTLCSSCD